MKFNCKVLTLSLTLLLTVTSVASPESDQVVMQLQKRWAAINYQKEGNAQREAFAQLVSEAELQTQNYSSEAAVWIWSGIIKSTYAGARGGLGALKYAKAAKADLEQGLELDADALDGSAYTSLGTLYSSVPGWPIGFGSDKKAEEMLIKALQINPHGIDPNYFYGKFLAEKGRDIEARKHFEIARQAQPRANQPLADAGRLEEIEQAIAALD